MVVDEESDVLENVKKFLDKTDVEIITATNNRSALEQLDEKHENMFDLILINTRFPGKKKSAALFSMKPFEKKEFVNIDNYLQKPFTKEQFLDFVKNRITL